MKRDVLIRTEFKKSYDQSALDLDLKAELKQAGLNVLDAVNETTFRAEGTRDQFAALSAKIGEFVRIAPPPKFIPLARQTG